jgi:ParB family chromosome partitioning protein
VSNKGFGDALADGYKAGGAAKPARPALPTDGVLSSRSSTLAELATGKLVTERTMWVRADRCRPWAHHNRDQELLNEETCADLIEAFKSEGRQRIPAIVRRIKDDPDFDYEIIAGVRRHWTVQWLNQNNYPDFEFLVTVQALTDEEAFRLADIENRARKDLTDLERARDYLKALDLFYGGKQAAMAERLNVTPAWLSRLLDLARMPAVIHEAFGDTALLKVEHAKNIAPLLRGGPATDKVLAEASVLADRQQAAKRAGEALLRPADVVRALQRAAIVRAAPAKASSVETLLSATKRPMLKVMRKRAGGLTIDVLPKSGADAAEILKAIEALLSTPVNERSKG